MPGMTTIVESEWQIDELDLEAYLKRIGISGSLEPTAERLIELQRAHVMAFPFENLEVLMGSTPKLDMGGIVDKLVYRERGGYCFELNALLAAAMERIGYRVERLIARITTASPGTSPRTHMLMRVHAPGEDPERFWIVDAGLGFIRPFEPLPFVEGEVVSHIGWKYTVASLGEGVWALRVNDDGEAWRELYKFALERQYPADYRVSNHYTATHPSSPFIAKPLIGLVAQDSRLFLRGLELTEVASSGKVIREISAGDLFPILSERFGIKLSEAEMEALRPRLSEWSNP